jgi:DNA-binding cell septation regulator SpoVG
MATPRSERGAAANSETRQSVTYTPSAPSQYPIDIVSIRCCETGALKAVTTVRVGPVLIHEMRVIQQDGQTPWLGAPQQQLRNGSWKTIVEIADHATWVRLRDTVLDAYRRSQEAGR